MAFYRALQVPSAILDVGSLSQQELFCFRSTSKNELFVRLGRHDSTLNIVEFNIEHLTEVARCKRSEHNGLVDTVHELGRELALGHVEGGVVQLPVKVRQRDFILFNAGSKTNASL